jgi:hypothetical protein
VNIWIIIIEVAKGIAEVVQKILVRGMPRGR